MFGRLCFYFGLKAFVKSLSKDKIKELLFTIEILRKRGTDMTSCVCYSYLVKLKPFLIKRYNRI